MFCATCGKEMLSDAKFCPSCGNQIAQTVPSQQVPTYTASFSTNSTVPLAKQKEKHIVFLFVTGLVFMILFAIRFMSTLGAVDEWKAVKDTDGLTSEISDALQGITDAIGLCLMTVTVAFVSVLIFFILTATLKGKKDTNNRSKLAKTIFAFSIIVLVAGAVYMVSEIILFTECKAFFDIATDSVTVDQSVLTDLQSQINSSFTGAMVFNITFIAFSIANVIKSQQLAKNIWNKENQQPK